MSLTLINASFYMTMVTYKGCIPVSLETTNTCAKFAHNINFYSVSWVLKILCAS